MKPLGPELWLAIVTLIGAVVLFALGKDEPAYLLFGSGGYGALRTTVGRQPASKIKPTNPPNV